MHNHRLVAYFAVTIIVIFAICLAAYSGSGGSSIWIEIAAGALLVVLLVFGVVTYNELPLLGDVARNDDRFWRSMTSTTQGVMGVVYNEKNIGPWIGSVSRFSVRRLIVTLKYATPKRDQILFRATENPNTESPEDTHRAFSIWIETAQKHQVPAVYRAGNELHVLSAQHIREMNADPITFLAKLRDHIQKGNPLSRPNEP